MNKNFSLLLLLALLLSSCIGLRVDSPAGSQPNAEEEMTPPRFTPGPARPTEPPPTPINILPTVTPTRATVTLTAFGGNLYIRRGPDIRFNQIGVLYEGTTVNVLARDVLMDWVQIQIPNSAALGWVSIQTKYSTLSGDPAELPEIALKEYPLPATVRNCTQHQIIILPGRYILNSVFFSPDNELWLPPGSYTAYDVDAPNEPEVLSFDIREGQEVEVQRDGLDVKRICP